MMSPAGQRMLLRSLGAPNCPTVLVRWQETAGGTLDPTTGHVEGGTVTEISGTYPGHIHEVTPARSGLKMFEEVEVGDVLLDMAPDVPLDGKKGLRFEIAGRTYVQADAGGKLAKHYDVLTASGGTFRSFHLKRAT